MSGGEEMKLAKPDQPKFGNPSPAGGRGWREAPGEGAELISNSHAAFPHPRPLSRARARGAALAVACCLLAAPALAQQSESPIPASGGALIMVKDAFPDPYIAGWNGEKVCTVLEENDRLRALKCSFAPGVGHERHYHAPHFGYVLEGGKMRITDKNGTREGTTKAGDTWASDGVEWHEVMNIGETTAVYIIVEPKGMTAPDN
jgi:quercetin dioxygenase-like cupin family protein